MCALPEQFVPHPSMYPCLFLTELCISSTDSWIIIASGPFRLRSKALSQLFGWSLPDRFVIYLHHHVCQGISN
jgi:hypothetical protein